MLTATNPKSTDKIDPFTLEIIKESLIAVGDEMFIAMQRTSMSTIIYEVLDYASGLLDAHGNLITQGNGVTGFLGTLTFAVRSILEKFADDMHPGDIFITNDPYSGGGTHLSDVTLAIPIFYDGKLVAFAANKAHWTEVGGMSPGSWTTVATDVWQEGVQFPCIKLYEKGVVNQGLIDLIRANVRTPDMSIGDMSAQAASIRMAERRFVELCDRYGIETVMLGIEALMDYGETMTRQALARIPKGTYTATDWIDDDGIGNGPFEMHVKVTVTDDKFICDFTGCHLQVPGPINAGRTGLESAVRVIMKAITEPAIPANEGCFRPLEIICPEGTIITATRPAPTSTYWETMEFAADLVWQALAPIVPERLTVGHFMSVCGTIVSGIHPDTGELFILVEPQAGGWGAGVDKDGENGLVCIGDGETYVIPVEVCETRYGVLVDQYALNIADGGVGRYRGGRGLFRDYRITADEAYVTGTFGRFKFLPWGLKGGRQGSPNYMEMIHADGTRKIFGKTAQYKLKRGEVARMATGTGGGYGDPFQRPEEEVVQDVRDGYLTPEMAERDYGIVVDTHTWTARNVRSRSKNDRQTGTTPARTNGIRPGDRTDAVLGILRGETSASAVALRFSVDKAEVERWVEQFLAGGEGAMRSTSSGDG
ncbi:MAG: hydantoinase B/oxoprolinase family protein [Candidatus Methanoperedens sp.]|nr:hydantoinase B/oxoprolinase family protein [Candidatus Methanoperedens sp.]